MSTQHMNTHHGGLEEGGMFFPALQGPSLQPRVGVGRHREVEMWIKQHGGKILGLLASVCFLLISHLVVLHVKLTTTLHSRDCAELSSIWQRDGLFVSQRQDIQRKFNPLRWMSPNLIKDLYDLWSCLSCKSDSAKSQKQHVISWL